VILYTTYTSSKSNIVRPSFSESASMDSPPEKEPGVAGEAFVSDSSNDGYDQDDKDMARMGKKQEFKRNFNWISSVGFTSCTMGT
jgi:hypothetical protein